MTKARDYKVAIIADEFTYNSFASEFQACPVHPDDWREVFEQERPDIFFCESAWSGIDSDKRPWKGQVYAIRAAGADNRETLFSILAYCRNAGIPTVFWNKEDPIHHDSAHGGFADTARHFDFVFTTAAECVDSYRNRFKASNVSTLPFATNPRLFNPIEVCQRSRSIVFAGSWYSDHWARIQDMETILDGLGSTGFDLTIYDRNYGTFHPLRQWPEKYRQYIQPAKSHDEMPAVYKSSIYGLNINTITDSKTMFARRVFELMSSNTLVVSNYAKGLDEMFGSLVVFADREPDRLGQLSAEQVNQIRHKALHEVLSQHTYKARWHTILTSMGLPYEDDSPTLTFVAVVASEQEAVAATSWFQQHGVQFNGSTLLLVANDTMAPSSVSELNRRFAPLGVTITSCHQLAQRAPGEANSPIRTTHFLTLSDGIMLSPTRIEEALLHLQYMDSHPLAPGATPRNQYLVGKADPWGALLDSSNKFNQWLAQYTGNQHIEAYLV